MLFLANVLGRPVHGKTGEAIGKLDDLIVRIGAEAFPPVAGLIIRDGRRLFFVPAEHLVELEDPAKLNSSIIDIQPFQRRDGEVLLSKDVLDHQIIDITGRRIVRVNDIQLARVNDCYRVVGVDISPQAIVRRLGPRALAARIIGRHLIEWAQVQYLASTAPVLLTVSYHGLSELNPVDLARIVDALSYRESAEIVAALDDETAAQTLEEVSDDRVADLLENMDQERAADILEEMDPGAAADALEDLGDEVAEQLLAKMEPEEAADVQAFLAYNEDSAGRIMTTAFVAVPGEVTVAEIFPFIRSLEDAPDPLLAVYVVDATPTTERPPTFRGLVRLRSILLADPTVSLSEIMEDDIPTVQTEDRAEDVARVLGEYNLLAVPVLDDQRGLIGVVTVDDALAVVLPDIWARRGRRIFG